MEKKRITILGSTGSIGTQALEVIEKIKDKFEIVGLTAGNNVSLIKEQIRKFNPSVVCVGSEEAKNELKQEFSSLKVLSGSDGLVEVCSDKTLDLLVVAVSGKIGLRPTLTAIDNGINIALANKETLVMAGDIVMKRAKDKGVPILPIDSEHCAIHQCIKNLDDVRKLIITASGGPFLNKTLEDIKQATVAQTLAHPNWNMGRKITVDSATLMNKGLEVIEAHHLFSMDYSNIEVVVHPQSIIHSAIEYKDGSIVAQIGLPSMHIPIQYAITYPNRVEGIKTGSFDFVKARQFDFFAPDFEKFPCLKMAYEAGKIGGSSTVCLNAANEEAVFAFLEDKIKLFNIAEIVEEMMAKHNVVKAPTIDEIFEIDNEIRVKTREFINK